MIKHQIPISPAEAGRIVAQASKTLAEVAEYLYRHLPSHGEAGSEAERLLVDLYKLHYARQIFSEAKT